MADNTVTLVGNITRDPELRYTAGGQATSTFGLAVNRRWQNRQTQEWEERVSFFDIVAYGTLGENVAESLQRGDRVMVFGRLEQRSWETQEGEKRSKVEVIADAIGPELRWATCEVTKNQRNPNRPPDEAYDEPGGQPAGRSSGNQSRPAQRREEPPTYDYDDEEPF